MPSSEIEASEFEQGIDVVDLFALTSLCSSKSEARRLVEQGGALVNERKIEKIDEVVSSADVVDGQLLLRAGKKRYHRIVVR